MDGSYGQDSFASAADAEAATAVRRELGRMLADLRRRAGFSQRELGRLTGYDHTVVAHSEKGRPAAGETFWKLADDALGAERALATAYGRLRNLELAAREKTRRQEQAARAERAAHWLPHGPEQSAPAVISGPTATVVCPNCGQAFELVPQVIGRKPGTTAHS
jgi:transcriptional regulator with XRE-family HTH domain